MNVTPEIIRVCLKHKDHIMRMYKEGRLEPNQNVYDFSSEKFIYDFKKAVYGTFGEDQCYSRSVICDKDCGGWDCWACAMKVGYDIIKKYGGVEYA